MQSSSETRYTIIDIQYYLYTFSDWCRVVGNGDLMNVVLFALTATISTGVGGLFALRFRDHLHLILGFTAGVLLGVVAFDILPEIFALANEYGLDPGQSMIALVVGFLLFHSIEKLTVIHHAQEESYAD